MHRYYMCHTGIVRSHFDGQEHIVRAGRVADLYGVAKRLCIMIDSEDELRGYSEEQLNKLIHLFPRSDGDYNMIPPAGVIENER